MDTRRFVAGLLVALALVTAFASAVGCTSEQGSTPPGSKATTSPASSEEASENDSIESTAEEGIESSPTTP